MSSLMLNAVPRHANTTVLDYIVEDVEVEEVIIHPLQLPFDSYFSTRRPDEGGGGYQFH